MIDFLSVAATFPASLIYTLTNINFCEEAEGKRAFACFLLLIIKMDWVKDVGNFKLHLFIYLFISLLPSILIRKPMLLQYFSVGREQNKVN